MNSFNFWRILEPLILGAVANIVINYIFDPRHPDFLLKEFLLAFVFAIIVTEVNRKINNVLDNKYNWTKNFTKRFLLHLIVLSLALFFILNVIGNIYLWFVGDSFHTIEELLIINLCVFIIALVLTMTKWARHFYYNWRNTEIHLTNSEGQLRQIKLEIEKSKQQLELIHRSEMFRVDIINVQLAIIEHGIVWIFYEENNKGIYEGSLNSLMDLLPEYRFFQVSRSTILRKDTIRSISSSSYGKIELKLKPGFVENTTITVSRPKAATFRKWYNSN